MFLCHFDGHGNKIRKIAVAAERPSTDADPPHDLCLVPDADLSQFDPGLEYAGQILHKLPEINSSVGRKIEQHLIVVKSILRIDKLHFQLVLLNLFLTYPKGFLLLGLIVLCLLHVPFVGDPNHGL